MSSSHSLTTTGSLGSAQVVQELRLWLGGGLTAMGTQERGIDAQGLGKEGARGVMMGSRAWVSPREEAVQSCRAAKQGLRAKGLQTVPSSAHIPKPMAYSFSES